MSISRLSAALLSVALFLGITGAAHADVITYQDVSFTTSTPGNSLGLEIDAAPHSGNGSADTMAALDHLVVTSELKGGFFAGNDSKKAGSIRPGGVVVPVPAPVPGDMALPEPGSVALLFGGMLAMGTFALRRRAR